MRFQKRVLDPAIKQINEHTDITVKVEQHKTGRSITGFSFKFKPKQQAKIEKTIDPKRDPNTPDFFIKMTDAQRHLFANKMSEMPEMSKYSQRYRKLSAICNSYCRNVITTREI